MKKKNVKLFGSVQELAETDALIGSIPKKVLDRIRQTDDHPFFALYTVGEEGESTGQIIGEGNVKKLWAQPVVKELSEQVRDAGVFVNHDKANDPTRPGVGYVVAGSQALGKGGKLIARAVAYIRDPETRKKITDKVLDICSIEAVLHFAKTASGWAVEKVEEVSGLALASSADSRAGFAGAGLVAAVQELETEDTMTKDEMIEALSKMGIEIATPDSREAMRKAIEAETARATTAADTKKQIDNLAAEKSKLESELKAERQKAFLAGAKSTIQEQARKILVDRKTLTETERGKIEQVLVKTLAGDSTLSAENLESRVKAETEKVLEVLEVARPATKEPPATKSSDGEDDPARHLPPALLAAAN